MSFSKKYTSRDGVTGFFLDLASPAKGLKLDWFFEVYLRRPELPELAVEDGILKWKTPGNLPFPMPIPLKVGEKRLRVDPGSRIPSEPYEIDPDRWILRKE